MICEKKSVQELKNFLCIKIICKDLKSTQHQYDETALYEILESLEKQNWDFLKLEEIIALIRNINSKNPLQNCIDLLRILQHFKLSFSQER